MHVHHDTRSVPHRRLHRTCKQNVIRLCFVTLSPPNWLKLEPTSWLIMCFVTAWPLPEFAWSTRAECLLGLSHHTHHVGVLARDYKLRLLFDGCHVPALFTEQKCLSAKVLCQKHALMFCVFKHGLEDVCFTAGFVGHGFGQVGRFSRSRLVTFGHGWSRVALP